MLVKQSTKPVEVIVYYTGGRKASMQFHTTKSAKHYAKSVCNNPNVTKITATGGELVGTHRLYGAME